MTDMLDRCARALAEYDDEGGWWTGDRHGAETVRQMYRERVLSLLRVLREPDEEMVRAANTVYGPDLEYGIEDEDMAMAITAAIDAIIPKEEKGE